MTSTTMPMAGGVPGMMHQSLLESQLHLQQQQKTNLMHPNQHTFECSNSLFTLDKRYQFIKVVGTGAYGVVISCRDTLTGRDVAIKKIPSAFDDLTDSKRILREMMLLRHLRHENIVSMLDIIHPYSTIDTYQDVYMVMDLMETDLHRIIYSRQPLSDEHAQFFLFQVLRALKYIHSAGVLHRDIKPSNLLINASCDLKICDFGLARGVNQEEVNLTEYVVTRWYRAPEIMLSCKTYTYGVDVWSTGCIFGELLQRKPLFPGEDYIHQLQIINEYLGSPSEDDMMFISSEKAKRFMRSLPRKQGVPFDRIFPNCNPLAIDLLRRMLTFDPAKRITVDEALAHPYLANFATPDSPNPTCDSLFEFKYEHIKLDATMLRELMWEEMSHYHPDAKPEWDMRRMNGLMHIDRAVQLYEERKAAERNNGLTQ
jgi:serine/threonine protein kinase